MAEFVIKTEGFRFGIFDKVPTAIPGQSILLYRSRNGINGSVLIDVGNAPMSADVRRGKFDTMVTFSMDERSKRVQDQVLIAGYQCYFNVSVDITYRLANVREYYFTESASSEKKLEQEVKDCIYGYDQKFDLHGSIELKREIERKLENKMHSFSYLAISQISVGVNPDDTARKLVESDLERMSSLHFDDNDADMEINRNRDKIRIQQSERELKRAQMQQFAEMYQVYGDMTPVMDEYLDKKMRGERVFEILREMKEEDLKYLKKGLDDDMLKNDFAQQEYAKKLVGGALSKENVLEIETSADAPGDQPEKYIDVQEIGDDDYL